MGSGSGSSGLQQLEKDYNTNSGSCIQGCKFGCHATVHENCSYRIPKPPYCQDNDELLPFETPEQLQSAITEARTYIRDNQIVTGVALPPAPPASRKQPFTLFGENANDEGIEWRTALLILIIVVSFTGGFCYLCTKKRVTEGQGSFEKINVG